MLGQEPVATITASGFSARSFPGWPCSPSQLHPGFLQTVHQVPDKVQKLLPVGKPGSQPDLPTADVLLLPEDDPVSPQGRCFRRSQTRRTSPATRTRLTSGPASDSPLPGFFLAHSGILNAADGLVEAHPGRCSPGCRDRQVRMESFIPCRALLASQGSAIWARTMPIRSACPSVRFARPDRVFNPAHGHNRYFYSLSNGR